MTTTAAIGGDLDNATRARAHTEPEPTGLGLVHEHGRSLRVTWQATELFRYVYQPWEPQLESPRPYLHPLRTLGGDTVSLYRPHDHVWHKGIAWSLSNVGSQNFWGGATYTREDGYIQLPNNGGMWHEGFDAIRVDDEAVRVDERLRWITEGGAAWVEEQRHLGVAISPADGAWFLTVETRMRNITDETIPIGSPTTQGRENAGYSGLFWRGPRSFTGGTIITPDGTGGDEFMGWCGSWVAFVGQHDGHDHASSVLFREHPGNFSFPTQWFVRSEMFACVCPAPFFSKEYPLPAGETLSLRYDVCVADGALDVGACGRLAAELGTRDLLAT